MTPRAALSIAAAVVGAVACGSGSDSRAGAGAGTGSGTGSAGPPPITGWEAACAEAFKTAPGLSPTERYGALAKACPVCGVDWQPVHDAMRVDSQGAMAADRRDLDRVLAACGGTCKKSARDAFISAIDDMDDPRERNKPWRALHRECPDAADKDGRYTSAPWYVLAQIGRALTASPPKLKARGTVEIPLPAVGNNGRGLQLPEAQLVVPAASRVHVTVLAAEVRVARAPTAQLGVGGLAIDGAPDYPGPVVAVKELGAAVDRALAGSKQPPLVLAPALAPAARLREVVAALDRHAPRLGVFGPPPALGWKDVPVATQVALRGKPGPGERVVIGLGPALRLGHAKGAGAVKDACVAPDLAWIAKNVVLDPGAEVVVALGEGTTVEAVAEVLDALAGIRVATVALVEQRWPGWASDLQACQ